MNVVILVITCSRGSSRIFYGDIVQEKLHMKYHPGTNPNPFTTIIAGFDDHNALLESTYCYPRGGGQPGDMGTMTAVGGKSSRIGEVKPGEKILHPLENSDYFEIGDEVVCTIDADRRNLHTRMHTAQHIVSALAEDIWGAETVGNQLTMDSSRVDLLFEDKSLFEPETLVSEVNKTLNKQIPVNIHEWSRDEIMNHEQMRHTKFMERIPSSISNLRVVEVEGIDLCPCAGTHVDNTASIPNIEFVSKKNKGKGRIRFSYTFVK